MVEPLVDTVDPNQVMSTEPYRLLHVDINTVTAHELDFSSDFTLYAARNDHVQGFVIYFDVEFAASHKSIGFGTGPGDAYTHWKQTTFYLCEDLIMKQGEFVTGKFSCKRNSQNHRELDISISYMFKGEHQSVKRIDDVYFVR